MANTYVIIPSFNSRPWIVSLIREVLSHKEVLRVVVVDDNSPDKAAALVKKTFSKNPKVKLIVRVSKGGRGSAVVEGFRAALKDGKTKYIIEMDADFAHNPSDIPKLLKANKKFDAVFGSRYLEGGETQDYGIPRKIFSFLANKWAKAMLGLDITDYTGGFRCYSRKALEKIDLSQIGSKGFIVLSEVAFRLSKNGLKIGEIPISAHSEKNQRSNLNVLEIVESLVTTTKLRFSGKV